MNTNESTTTAAATVSPASNSAPAPAVVAIVPTTDAWQSYLDAIRDGAPTGKILPAPLGQLTLTDAQRDELRAARKDNALFAQQNRKLLHRLTSRKCYTAGGVRIAKNANVSLRFVAADGQRKNAARAVAEFRSRLAAS